MIDLTPLDVRKKKDDFHRSIRGYDADQVGAFLDLVADRLEELVHRDRSVSERVESLERQLAAFQDRERALNEALLTAQELREEARAQAEREAGLRLREAESEAEALRRDATRAERESADRLEELRARRRHFLHSFRAMLEGYLEDLEIEEHRLAVERERPEPAPAPAAVQPAPQARRAAEGRG